MRHKLLLATTAIALLAGTAAASAQNTYQHIQSRDFRQSQGDTRHMHKRGNYSYRGYGWGPGYAYDGPGYAYDAAPGYYGYGEGPGVYVAPGWGYRSYGWGW